MAQVRISEDGGVSRVNSAKDITTNTEETNKNVNSVFDDNDNKGSGYANFAKYKKEVSEFMANFQETFKNVTEENAKLEYVANKLGVEVEDFTLEKSDDRVGGYAEFAKHKKEISEKLANYQETFKKLTEENEKLQLLVQINELKSQLQAIEDINNGKSDNGIKYSGIG